MKHLTLAALVVALSALFHAPVLAQDIVHGTWTGAMTPPGGQPVPVTLLVGEVAGALTIVMSNPELGTMDLSDEALDGDELTFWWNPGTRVDCTLSRQNDGSFEGPCADDRGSSGGQGALRMSPPAG
jgi:hypothetical protein